MHRDLGRVRSHPTTFTHRAVRHGFGGHGVRCSRPAVVHVVHRVNCGRIARFCRGVTSNSLSIGLFVSHCIRTVRRIARPRSMAIHDTRNCGLRRDSSCGRRFSNSILIVSRGLGNVSFGLTRYYGPVCNSRIFNFIAANNNVGVRHYSYPGTPSLRSHFNCHMIGTH